MKIVIWGVVAALCRGAALLKAQEVPTSEMLDTFNWTSEEVAPLIADRANTYSKFIPSFPTQLPLNYSGTVPKQFTLRTLGPAVVSRITAKHYAIVGKLRYSDVTPGSYLEMWSYFAPEQPGGPEGAYFTRTLGDSGPMAKLEGSDDGSDFALAFDVTDAKTKLVRLVLNLHLAGPGSVELSDVKLVQYPDAPEPATPAPTVPSTAPAKVHQIIVNLRSSADHGTAFSIAGTDYSDLGAIKQLLTAQHQSDPNINVVIRADKNVPYNDLASVMDAARDANISSISIAVAPDRVLASGFNWKSFLLGVAATGASLLLGGGIIFMSRRWNRRCHERELRRIASLDS